MLSVQRGIGEVLELMQLCNAGEQTIEGLNFKWKLAVRCVQDLCGASKS